MSNVAEKEESDCQEELNNKSTWLVWGIPAGVFPLLETISAERFTYDGLGAALQVYLTGPLALSGGTATVISSTFMFWSYLSCLPAGALGDSRLGRQKGILLAGVFYTIGLTILTLTSMPKWQGHGLATAGISGMILFVGIGMGFFKTASQPMIAEQLEVTDKREISDAERSKKERVLATIFRLYYWFYNLGSATGRLVIPLLHKSVSFTVAFAFSEVLLFVSMLGFGFAVLRHWFLPDKPTQNILAICYGIIRTAILHRNDSKMAANPYHDTVNDSTLEYEESKTLIHDNVSLPLSRKQSKKHWLDVAKEQWPSDLVEGLKEALRAIRVFLPYPVYYALFNQQTNNWTNQAGEMDLHLYPGGPELSEDMISLVNPVMCMLFVPLLDRIFFPLMTYLGFPLRPITRMVIGSLIATFAFVLAGLLQLYIQQASPNSISIYWQLPQYAFITLSELFVVVSGIEFAFSQSPQVMRGMVNSVFNLTRGLGSLIVIILTPALNSLDMAIQFWVFAGLMLLFTIIFGISFRNYRYKDEES